MLSESKLSLLQEFVQNVSYEELIWTKGYLAGFSDRQNNSKNTNQGQTNSTSATTLQPLILYGTETGNAKKVATQLLTSFKKAKIKAKVADVFEYDIKKLAKEDLVLFVISTQGEGELPQNAKTFYDKLNSSKENLSHLKYAVFESHDYQTNHQRKALDVLELVWELDLRQLDSHQCRLPKSAISQISL